MARHCRSLLTFLRDEEGAALAEYGLLIALIAIVCITAITIFGRQISDKFDAITTGIS